MKTRTLTASDRSALIRLASELPIGDAKRKAILAGLSKAAASEIDIEDLNPMQKQVVDFCERAFRVKPVSAFSGIHGSAVSFEYSGLPPRMTAEALKKLVSLPAFRWIEQSSFGNEIMVGM